jgi:hypothetical protein
MPPTELYHSISAGDFIKHRYHDLNSFLERSGITPELTRREASHQAFSLADERQAESGRVE